MSLESIFCGKCRCLTITSFIILVLGLFGSFVSTAVYYTKIKPWMKQSNNLMLFGYYGSIVNIAFSLFALVLLALMIIFSICPSCRKSECLECLLTTFICLFTFTSFIAGICSSVPELSSPSEKAFPMCYDYLFDAIVEGGLDYAYTNNKVLEYVDWVIDILFTTTEFQIQKPDKKQFKEKNSKLWAAAIYAADLLSGKSEALMTEILGFITIYTAGQGTMNSKLCGSAGIPTLLFGLVEIFGVILFIFATCCSCCCCCGKSSNDSNEQAIQSSSLL